MNYVRKKYKKQIVFSILMGMIKSIFAIGIVLLVRYMTNIVMDNDMNKWHHLIKYCIFYLSTYAIIYYISTIDRNRLLSKIRIFIKQKVFESMLFSDYFNFLNHSIGSNLSTLNNDISTITDDYYNEICEILNRAVSVIISLLIVSVLDIWISLGIIVILVLYWMITRNINKRLANIKYQYLQSVGNETSFVQEIVQNFDTIKDYQVSKEFELKYSEKINESHNAYFKYSVTFSILAQINIKIEPLLSLVILVGGSFLASLTKNIQVADIIALSQIMVYMTKPVSSIGSSISKIKSTSKIRDKLDNLIDEGIQGRGEWSRNKVHSIKSNSIKLKNVSFKLGNNEILKNVSLEFEEGKHYAIIGKSGEGKSTILRILLKLFDNYEGQIYLGEMNYKNINKADVATHISYLGQDTFLFNDTIKNNITLSKEGDYQKSLVKSNVLSIIDNQSRGDNTQIEEFGKNLSGGERQRIAIARTLYTDKPVVILDEFCSALDEHNASLVEKSLLSMKGKTIISTTHKLAENNYADYDFVYEISNGYLKQVYPEKDEIHE